MDMIDMLDEAGTYHLVTDNITHPYFDTRIRIDVFGINILFNRFHGEVVLALGSVVAAGFDSGLAG